MPPILRPPLRPPIAYKYLGPSISYLRSLDLQEHLVTRRTSSDSPLDPTTNVDILLLLQHRPTYTAGRRIRGTDDTEGERLRGLGAEYHEVFRPHLYTMLKRVLTNGPAKG